jgi:amidohydrolase
MPAHAAIAQEIERRRAEILGLSRRIHADPELAFEEVRTSRLLQSVLLAEGFDIAAAAEALPTSFRAVHRRGADKPRIIFTAEMDALPGIGHACGHNIIGTAGAYAAIVLKSVLGREVVGTIEVVGTPAEEKGSGKVRMIQDVVLQIHPHMLDTVICQALARRTLVIEFFGKKAHAAAAPNEGRNALDALVLFYHSAALPRSKFPAGTLFHGIIESGGEAPNIIPDYARGRFSLRADTMAKLERLVGEVRCLAEKAAADTGCQAKIDEPGPGVTTFRRNRVLEEIFVPLFEERGRSNPAKLRESYGSTDLANVSWVVPTIEPMIKASDFPIHTEGFARDAGAAGGERALLDGVFFLAAAAARILTDPALLDRIRSDFRARAEDAPEGIA